MAFQSTLNTFNTLREVESLLFPLEEIRRSVTPYSMPDMSVLIPDSPKRLCSPCSQSLSSLTPLSKLSLKLRTPRSSSLQCLESPHSTPTCQPPVSSLMAKKDMPMANSREAPNFIADPSGFDTFFEDVEELAKRADLPNSEKIHWACRYAGSESDSWRRVPCLNREGHNPTFDEFKKQVLKGYPQLSHEDRYTIRDLQRLTDQTRDYRDIVRESPPPTPREAYLPQRPERTQKEGGIRDEIDPSPSRSKSSQDKARVKGRVRPGDPTEKEAASGSDPKSLTRLREYKRVSTQYI